MDPIPDPHDRFFRESFGRREIARDFLRHQLPAELLADLDLETLAIGKDSYVSKELRTSYSDLVYSVAFRGGTLRVYLLFEHKSRPEFWTVLQLLRYVVLGGEQFRKQHPAARHLPPVYPLVLYHGARRWHAPEDFQSLVRPMTEALRPYVPRFRYALHDISARSDRAIRGELLTRLAQLALRHVHDDRPLERLRELLLLTGEVLQRDTALEMLESVLRYYVQGTQRLDEGDVRALLEVTPGGDQIMQTFIDKYIDQGRREGHREGRQEGRRQEGALVLIRLLELKFGPPSEPIRRRIDQADPETLLRWSGRVLTAQTLEAVFD